GDAEHEVLGVAPLERARPDQLGLLADRRYLAALGGSHAGALLVSEELAPEADERPRLVVAQPHAAMAVLLEHFHPPFREAPGVHPTAVLGEGVRLGEGVHVGPYAVVEDGAVLGEGVILRAHVVVGRGARIGAGSVLFPHAVVYPGAELGERVILHAGARVGVDGFGYVPLPDGPRKIPHVGGCVLEDDVELGANTCVDRGSIDETRIGRGSKLDNLVHIAHNVRVGAGSLMAALVGIAGSTRIGAGTMWGGQSGAIDHMVVGDGVRVSAQAGITTEVPPGETMMGFPARPMADYLKAYAATFRLGELRRRVAALEKEVQRLRGAGAVGGGDGDDA
ncbi:MAG: UDP-3-O-(3-hydroxymyristoyl)glucosamine N-acyltransferase, partial [Gemmatimonadetes bacterium]